MSWVVEMTMTVAAYLAMVVLKAKIHHSGDVSTITTRYNEYINEVSK